MSVQERMSVSFLNNDSPQEPVRCFALPTVPSGATPGIVEGRKYKPFTVVDYPELSGAVTVEKIGVRIYKKFSELEDRLILRATFKNGQLFGNKKKFADLSLRFGTTPEKVRDHFYRLRNKFHNGDRDVWNVVKKLGKVKEGGVLAGKDVSARHASSTASANSSVEYDKYTKEQMRSILAATHINGKFIADEETFEMLSKELEIDSESIKSLYFAMICTSQLSKSVVSWDDVEHFLQTRGKHKTSDVSSVAERTIKPKKDDYDHSRLTPEEKKRISENIDKYTVDGYVKWALMSYELFGYRRDPEQLRGNHRYNLKVASKKYDWNMCRATGLNKSQAPS